MKTTTGFFAPIIFISMFILASAEAQTANLITADSAGKVKPGMTVAEARKALAPLKLERTSDGEGVALIAVKRGPTAVMTLYAGEEDASAPLNENARIRQIWVWDRSFRTASGVHPGMSLAEAEKRYGKISEIARSEMESREFATFSNHPDGIAFRLSGVGTTAGVYSQGSRTTTKYDSRARISSINVVGRAKGGSEADAARQTSFSSEFTELKTGCRRQGGEEGGHVLTTCRGPGGYQVEYGDTATSYSLAITDAKRDWRVFVTMFGLGDLEKVSPAEWRLANGRPFAAIFTHPGTGKVFVRGMKGFERLKFEEEGPGALDGARSMADEQYARIVIPATRINFADKSTKVVVKGKITAMGDTVKYVVKAKAGYLLTVSAGLDKWTGEDGPVLVVAVGLPDGGGGGEPGGVSDVLTQDGDHEITVYQNRARSQAENIEFTLTATLAPKGT